MDPNTSQVATIQRPTNADWIRYQDVIKRLYLYDNLTIEQLSSLSQKHFNFCATPRMFKTRLENWGVYKKKLRAEEVLLMARVRDHRKTNGIESEFWRYGRRVSPANFERYLRDHPHIVAKLERWFSHDQVMKGHIEAILPPHILVLTPSPALSLKDELHSIESMLVGFQDYIKSTIQVNEPIYLPKTVKLPCIELWHTIHQASQSDSKGVISIDPQAFSSLAHCFDCLWTSIQAEGPFLILGLLASYLMAKNFSSLQEIAHLWLRQARDLCGTLKGMNHPLSVVLHTLVDSESKAESHLSAISILFAVMTKIYPRLLEARIGSLQIEAAHFALFCQNEALIHLQANQFMRFLIPLSRLKAGLLKPYFGPAKLPGDWILYPQLSSTSATMDPSKVQVFHADSPRLLAGGR